MRFPPLNIMIPANCHTPRELLDKLLPRDAIHSQFDRNPQMG